MECAVMSKEKIIFTNGCFDILHRGHIELLKYCKSLGYVVVGLNSDSSVKKLKGQNRPIFIEKDRKLILESVKYVDKVIVFEEETPYRLIKEIMPAIVVKGGDYKAAEVIGSDLAEVRIFKLISGYSTTRIIDKISPISYLYTSELRPQD
jgi:D-beta-D-heptose 7-phosphate kinase/D-beta-D-heptose 1-phosphate adenosyltransferase